MQMVCSGATSEFTVFCVSMFASVLLHVCFCLSAENVSVCVCARACQQVAGSIHQCLKMTGRG